MFVPTKAVSRWLKTLGPEFREYLLTKSDPARVVALREFDIFIRSSSNSLEEVAVVSGSPEEPELKLIPAGYNLTLLNYEENPVLFDLTLDWSNEEWQEYHSRFDLVLCEQVLEHLPEPQTAFNNLRTLAKEGGIIHVSTPAMNNTHGEPFFFFSGFHPRTLKYFASKSGLTDANSGGWASDKASRMYATCDWAPLSESGPLRFLVMSIPFLVGKPKRLVRTLLSRVRSMFLYPFQQMFSKVESTNYVISWSFTRRI